ncbi:Barstar (barnase inhibitor) [Variovorax sp. CF313]|uniref:barstar family protein n=1 Tax=Variovorax sp. CF313 TaxID=1144315 RepID=UPI00027119A8|nr:barstar family protein [Variovorax sp. CF313]EJL68224.1 Barstar (barnase inhibitor) [Variovorax sp. CF313]
MPITGPQYLIELHGVRDMDAFTSAFNTGLINAAGGHWGGNWDAFNDYLSWPAEDSYTLILDGWTSCNALGERDLAIFEGILASNPHVLVRLT